MNIHELGVLLNNYVNSKSLISFEDQTPCCDQHSGDQLRRQSSFMHYHWLSNIFLITICIACKSHFNSRNEILMCIYEKEILKSIQRHVNENIVHTKFLHERNANIESILFLYNDAGSSAV